MPDHDVGRYTGPRLCFNASLVRLDVHQLPHLAHLFRSFNASLVRLDEDKTRWYHPTQLRFNASLVRLDASSNWSPIWRMPFGFNASLVRLDAGVCTSSALSDFFVSMPVWFD